jgi:hypothetical protein
MTILNSFLLLTSCGARMTHKQFRLALMPKLIEKDGSVLSTLICTQTNDFGEISY